MKASLFVVITVVLIFLGCSGENPIDPGGDEEVINLGNNSFSPKSLTVSIGTTVRWINNGNDFHTIEHGKGQGSPAANPAFNLLPIQIGESQTHTFNAAGIFDFYCSRHPQAGFGTITVTAQ